ncbi:MAG: RibD family protein [Candidatus Bathyarchaeia archaeon]|jgi:2,5-diamino-6-(ribosylamino)-4(3H)-pyrimidinone 5'-phosphate reductase
MLPKVVVYNSVSVDGAIKDFDVDIALHYEVLGRFGADALLAGSQTAKSGIELFLKEVPPEEESDYQKPLTKAGDDRPIWIIPDSRGILQGLLHVHRKSGYAKDIVVLVSKSTPKQYLAYLVERHYDYIVAGDDHVDYRVALEELNSRYNVEKVVTDSGGILAGVLFEQGLVDELHLLVAPELVGKKAVTLFRNLGGSVKLELIGSEAIKGHVLLSYQVSKQILAKMY